MKRVLLANAVEGLEGFLGNVREIDGMGDTVGDAPYSDESGFGEVDA